MTPNHTQVFNAYQAWRKEYDDISVLDTRTFLQGLKLGTFCGGRTIYLSDGWLCFFVIINDDLLASN